MALAATTIHEVRTTGDDTNNGGAFDPGQTAGMLTDGAATSANTSAPVFTSASYSFVAGDAGAWLFIASGTNWTPGWYQIASVSGGAATLTATAGSAVIGPTSTMSPSTATGCATVASPTSATWSIDYSQQAAAQFTYTDLASAGAGLTVSSAAKPFAKQHVGNSIVITGGTNFTAGRYVIASVAASVATVVGPGNITTGAGANGTGGMGGSFASGGALGGILVASNRIFLKTGTYTVTSASTNVANGCMSIGVASISLCGYDTVRGDLDALGATGTRPTIVANGVITTFTLINHTTFNGQFRNLILDGNSRTSSRGLTVSADYVYNVKGQNFTNGAFNGPGEYDGCFATACATQPAFVFGQGVYRNCVASGNSVTGFSSSQNLVAFHGCISAGNTGASSDGFAASGSQVSVVNCASYGNGRDGVRLTHTTGPSRVENTIVEGNSGFGVNVSNVFTALINNAYYNNTSGAQSLASATRRMDIGGVTLTASPFTNAAGGDFSLNTSAGGGAACRAAGFPGVFPNGTTTGYVDIGAAQHADPVATVFAMQIFGG